MSDHYEVFLHAVEREIPETPVNMLIVGVGNGGDVEIWRDVLPEGSTVTAIDRNAKCGDLGIDVLVGDPSDKAWLLQTLGRAAYDIVIWSHAGVPEAIWPWITPGGRLVVEGLWPPTVIPLVSAVVKDVESWLPTEEIMRVTVFPHVLVVEKRNARVLSYIRIMTGNFAEVIPEADLIADGVKRVLVD